MTKMFRVSILYLLSGFAVADTPPRILFDFSNPTAARQWQSVNDGVMGGRSIGQFRISDDNHLVFSGNLSLANNGGFASVLSRSKELALQTGDTIVMKVRGDGRNYNLNLYPTVRRTAFSFRADFETKKSEWTEVKVRLSDLVATSFGRTVQGVRLNPNDINGIGILLGDKKAGPFQLEVSSISVVRP
jgi:NADH dehydrogenase [ubiquinone] 1 alpha subcomplex assembly factor 1